MKTMQLELPDQLAKEVGALVSKGWFVDESEAARFALQQLVERQRFQLMENQQLEDIAWAKAIKGTPG